MPNQDELKSAREEHAVGRVTSPNARSVWREAIMLAALDEALAMIQALFMEPGFNFSEEGERKVEDLLQRYCKQ